MSPGALYQIQMILQRMGYTQVICNGYYDGFTRNAVIDFQQRNYMMDDGELQPNTVQALYHALKPVEAIKPQVVNGSYESPSIPSYPLNRPMGVQGD